jgi:hypothetical protein
VTIARSGSVFLSRSANQLTISGDYGAFGFGVVGNTTTIATDGTGLARIQAGTGITATNSGGTVTISSTAGATNLNFEPKSGSDILLNSSTGADVNFRDGTNIVLTRDASNIMSINTNVAYGQLYNSTLINDATLDGTYRLVDFILNEFQSPIIANASLDRITVASAGTYEISYDLTYTLPSQVRDVIFRVYKNTSSIGYKGETISTHPSSTQALFTTVSKTFIATLAANDYISLQMYSAGSSTTIDINSPILTVKRLY